MDLQKQRETGLRIQFKRKMAKLRQFELSAQLGISPNYLSAIERGAEKVSTELLLRIAKTLNCAITDLSPDRFKGEN
jgi:transcriptional regulator with XRE-family HTH domain